MMTEAEWLTANDPTPMLEFLQDHASERKLRLFAAACCWRVWDQLLTEGERAGVAAIERLADDPTATEERNAALTVLQENYVQVYEQGNRRRGAYLAVTAAMYHDAAEAADMASASAAISVADDTTGPAWNAERQVQAVVLRDTIGNPFRPTTVDPSWLTSTVVQLAEGIDAERAYDRLPILADALQDAGCENVEILSHCRGDGPHVRGCWVVDVMLGKG